MLQFSRLNFGDEKKMINKKALLMVDLQNDFCAGGNLAVPGGDEIISLANQLQEQFDIIIATQDWHPNDHFSFAINHPQRQAGEIIDLNGIMQILWPAHCVQNTKGAAFHPRLDTQKINKIFYKGTDYKVDSYSAFFDNAKLHSTGLADYLRDLQVDTLYIMGLATDYCVKFTALDAISLDFNVYLIEDACRGVELHTNDIAINEMQAAGVKIISGVSI